jgi:hypothetical protein
MLPAKLVWRFSETGLHCCFERQTLFGTSSTLEVKFPTKAKLKSAAKTARSAARAELLAVLKTLRPVRSLPYFGAPIRRSKYLFWRLKKNMWTVGLIGFLVEICDWKSCLGTSFCNGNILLVKKIKKTCHWLIKVNKTQVSVLEREIQNSYSK